jgi:hypothetical protein
VLTAAHCVEEVLRRVLVRFDDNGSTTGVSLQPLESRPHPKHVFGHGQTYAEDLAHIKYDIGLIHLATPAPSTKPRASFLAQSEHGWIASHLGTTAVSVLGYGATSVVATDNNGRALFRGTGFLAVPDAMTEPVTGLRLDTALGLTNNEALVLDYGHGAQMCYGDSGGPLLATDDSAGGFLVVGVNSWILDSSPERAACDRGSVHPAVSHPENAEFISSVLADWAD